MSGTYIEDTKVVDGNHAAFQLLRNFDAILLVRTENASTETVSSSICNLDSFFNSLIWHD